VTVAVSGSMLLAQVVGMRALAGQQGQGKSRVAPGAAPVSSSAPGDEGRTLPRVEQTRSPAVEKGRPASASLANYFPNVSLLTQDNRSVRFYDDLLKGKVVVISFMFTTCTTLCPQTTGRLAKVQELFGDRLGRDIFILSISVDPANDTPAALKKYADSYNAKPGWYFLTGETENVQKVRAKLGVYDEDKMQHTGMLIFGNEAAGQWRNMPARRTPIEIANAVMGLMPTKGK